MPARVITGVLLTAATAVVAVLGPQAPDLVRTLAGPHFPAALEALGSLVLLGLGGWAVLVSALALGASRATWAARLLRRVAPRLVVRVVVGGAVGAGLAAPIAAGATSLDGLPYPDRPTGGTTAAVEPMRARPAVAPAPHVVRAGDSLWSIAAQHLPAGAGPSDVARATARWHAANRAVIGDDPDLIQPGQRLRPPTKDTP